jgi:NAD(P)-dependent dehydrogenase (short-subunit alcohol dehydrogenase family)
MNGTLPRTVIVTGAAGNLGRAVAEAFSKRGAQLVLVARDRAELVKTYGSENAQQLFAVVDLLDQVRVDGMAAMALERFGRIDILCNLAGGFRMGDVQTTSDADWDFLFDVNLRTLRNAVRAVVPSMLAQGGGKIVNVAAAAAIKAGAHVGAYAASKAGVIRLTEALAAELRERNINVNCVLPTTIDTPQNRAAMPKADPKRWVAPADLANVIAFLASDEARAIHGAAIPVSGLS